MRLGMIGLGKMGSGMSERLLEAGHEVVGFDPSEAAREGLTGAGGAAVASLEALVEALETPRCVWTMVPAGKIVEETLEKLGDLLASGDTVVDGGNSNYKRTLARGAELDERGIELVDAGTSGGVWGRGEG